jgi:hypothetical protein
MPHLPVSPIEIARVAKQKRLHEPTQRHLFNLNKKVKMILHQSVSIKAERVSALIVHKIGKKLLPVFLIKEYTLSSISSGDDMIQSSWKMDSRLTSHRKLSIKER